MHNPDPPPRARCCGRAPPPETQRTPGRLRGTQSPTSTPGLNGPRSRRPASQLHPGPCSGERAGDEEADSSISESPRGGGRLGHRTRGMG